ncbi:MAG: bifunctional DNA-binding transcriptional regulator/O6-methylguanine-DNA methyltransferase Ada [Acidimicrobiales bacterium]
MDAEARWRAVVAHDATADGRFVYAVRSTGVYCRPSCPSRRPGRENVEFFGGPDQAEAGGYRPCRRCRPRATGTAPTEAARAVAAACRLLELDDELAPTLANLAARVGMSPSHLSRSFKRLLGMTPRQYGAEVRLERARRGLRAGAPVTDAIYGAGYGSSRAFYEGARAGLGMTPSAYRRGGAAQRIAYTVVASRLGEVLVATTGEGVCAVRFVDGDAEARLGGEFPAATTARDDGALAEAAAQVVAAVDGEPGAGAGLPLDVRATAFQLRVWQALRAIPRGQTRSYTEVARSIGHPAAVRAVAGACAANPVALLVPCHRVVASSGSLAGYRWGTDRKRALLEAEGAALRLP